MLNYLTHVRPPNWPLTHLFIVRYQLKKFFFFFKKVPDTQSLILKKKKDTQSEDWYI